MDMHGATPADSGSGAPPDPVFSVTAVVDARGIVTGWSAGAERLLGYLRQDVVGRPVTRLLTTDVGIEGGVPTVLADAVLDEWSGTASLRHRDGRRVEVWLRAYPSWDAEGNVQRIIVATPQEKAPPRPQPTMGAAEATTEAAFAQSRLPVVIYDRELRTVRASAGAAHELGLTEEQMRGRRITEMLPPHVCRTIEDGMRRVFESGEPEQFHVQGRPRQEARDRTWSVTASPIRTPTGLVRHVQLTALDVTEQHRARERLALLNDVGTQVGSTLDVTHTAQEMADVAVGRLADFVTVDLLDSLFRGVEPRPSTTGTVALRRAAHQSVLPGAPEAVIRPGEVDYYPESTPPVRCLATGRASLHRTLDAAIRDWQAADPARSAVVRAFGIHSIMVIPLTARGITLGVAILVRHRRSEPFEEDDLLLAEEIGARAAVAVDNARRFTRERDTALALQRSLLPQRLSAQEAVEVAFRYLPAHAGAGVGGDWFDVIPLSGARVALVVGDVVGHGLRASATMGRLRTAVRTLADVDLPPDELLVHLDDLVSHLAAEEEAAAQPEPGPGLAISADAATASATAADEVAADIPSDVIATCLYVVYDPVSCRCTAATAGHPPPAVVRPDGSADFLDLVPGPPLGVGGLPFERAEWELPRGSLLALYTDGLIEGAEHDLDTGLSLLRRHLARPARSPEAVCDNLIQALLPAHPADDVALLVARTRALDAGEVATWDVPSDPAAVADARTEAMNRLADWGLHDIAFTAELMVSELVTNAIRYGRPPVQLRLIHTTSLLCEVSDGSSTAPHLRRARTFDEGGRGLLLVAQLADRWGTRHHAGGKTIWAEVGLSDERV